MEELGSMWGYQESKDDLRQNLLDKNFELEFVRVQANEEIRRHKENVNQLLQHLETAYKERDETRDQIHKLLNKFPLFNAQSKMISSQIQLQPSKTNSSITESNSLSDTYNYQSPNDYFFDIISSSPEYNKLGYANHQHQQPLVIDQGCLVIESLAKGKPLPQKGKLLTAVLEAGPLLKTFMVAAPIPSWQNPPPIKVSPLPHVSSKGCDSRIINLGQSNNKSSNVFSFSEMGCGTSQMVSSGSLKHFIGGPCFGGAYTSEYGLLGKRQKLQ